jgi:hypothetical protein
VTAAAARHAQAVATPVHSLDSAADEDLLIGVDKATQKRILDVAVDKSPGVAWSDISGLDLAKRALYEVRLKRKRIGCLLSSSRLLFFPLCDPTCSSVSRSRLRYFSKKLCLKGFAHLVFEGCFAVWTSRFWDLFFSLLSELESKGCGKTMLAKAVATESKTAFFSM